MLKAISHLKHWVGGGPTQEPDEMCLLAPPRKTCNYCNVVTPLGEFIRGRNLVSDARQVDHDLHSLQRARDKMQRMSEAGPTGSGSTDLLE